MPDIDPVDTGGGSPAGGSPDPVVTGETVPKERFDGLMSSFNKAQERAKELERQLAAAQAPAQPAPAQPVVPAPAPAGPNTEEILSKVDEVSKETRQVFSLYRNSIVKQLLEQYPYATAEDAKGSTEEDWTDSLRKAHERVKAVVDKESAAREEAVSKRFAQEFGVPLSIAAAQPASGLSAEEEWQARYDEAVKAGDRRAVAKLILLKPSS